MELILNTDQGTGKMSKDKSFHYKPNQSESSLGYKIATFFAVILFIVTFFLYHKDYRNKMANAHKSQKAKSSDDYEVIVCDKEHGPDSQEENKQQ